jgi:hypothetical protein
MSNPQGPGKQRKDAKGQNKALQPHQQPRHEAAGAPGRSDAPGRSEQHQPGRGGEQSHMPHGQSHPSQPSHATAEEDE